MENLKCWGKRLLKYGLIGLALIIGIKIIAGNISASKKPVQSVVVTDSSKKITAPLDFSQRREDVIVGETILPDSSEDKVTVLSIPCYKVKGGTMWYLATLSPAVRVKYDLLDGKTPIEDGPGEMHPTRQPKAVVHIRATGKGGKMTVTLNRQFLSDPTKKSVSESRFVKTVHREEKDVPHSVQRM